MNSPLKKTKQSSLSEFYKKLQSHQQNLNVSNLQHSTPKKSKSNIQHDINNKFAGKIQTSESYSRLSHPLIDYEEYNKLDINSNMKIKLEDVLKSHSPSSEIKVQDKSGYFYEDLSKKPEYLRVQRSQFQPHSSELMTKKFQNQESQIDYNLSVEPEEIKIPEVDRYENGNKINQFKIFQDDKFEGNYLITPEPSLIKSPQKIQGSQIKNFTPQRTRNQESNQAPTSEIIERLNFNMLSKEKQQIGLNQFNKVQNKRFQTNQPSYSPFSNVKQQIFVKNTNSPHRSLKKVLQKHHQSNIPPSPTRKQKKEVAKQPQNIIYNTNNSKPEPLKNQTHTQTSPKPKKPTSIPKKPCTSQILSSDDQDSSQIFSKLKQLQSQVQILKTHKYQYTISKYRQQIKHQLNKKLQQDIQSINKKYQKQQNQLQQQMQSTNILYNKSLQDILKYKKTYSIILEQLKQNRGKIEEQYVGKVEEAKKYKQKLISQWKRQSNQEIKKIMNNTHAKNQLLRIDNNNKKK